MTRYIVIDNKGIIHESNNYAEAQEEFENTTKFEGDLIFAEIIKRRH
jgi:hypothetical protein